MAENEGGNMYKFNLSFQQSWHPRELIRRGRRTDPLNRKLRTVSKSDYEEALLKGTRVRHTYDFVYDDDEIIIYGLSNGKSNIYIYIYIIFFSLFVCYKWTKRLLVNKKYRTVHIL